MESLQILQKVFRVFQILTKIAMILSFVWAGLAALGLLCGTVWYTGGTVIGAERDVLFALTNTAGLDEMLCALLTNLVFALTDSTLFLFAWRYLKAEQLEGTPFTRTGALRIRRLGVRTIVLPLVATIFSAMFYSAFALPVSTTTDWNNLPSVSMGIVLLLASLIFRYGAELEEKAR